MAHLATKEGVALKTVLPSTSSGMPALGCTTMGRSVKRAISCITSKSFSGPVPQLAPMMSAPAAWSITAAAEGVVPKTVFAPSSNVMVTWMGMDGEISLTARMAAFASRVSAIVSMMMKSAPPSISGAACSLKAATASLNDRSPSGSTRRPRGPMDAPTRALPPAAFRAIRTPSLFIFITESPRPQPHSLNRFAPNVFVWMTSAPASMLRAWASATRTGSVRLRASGHSPGLRPSSWRIVPIAPSYIRMRFPSRSSRSLICSSPSSRQRR